MTWAKRLKRVFGIQIEGFARCGGKLKFIASIEEPAVLLDPAVKPLSSLLAGVREPQPKRGRVVNKQVEVDA